MSSQWSLSLANQILGIKSPSRVWITPERIKARQQIDPPAPWYSAHGPRESWETPELRNAARRVRRLIRRHWFDLMFRPDEPIATAVKQAMKAPPKKVKKPSLYQQTQELLDAGAIGLKPGVAEELMKQYGVKLEE